MKVLCILVSVVVAVNGGYHEQVGIPLAARIKQYEDRIFADVPAMESRVVGGHGTSIHAHPYLVGLIMNLRIGMRSVCGSSLVTATRLLTAAHCMEGAGSAEAVLGSNYLFLGGARMTTKKFKVHPRYNPDRSTDYDIAVVNLPRPVKFSATIKPIPLPSKNGAEVVGEWATAAGWGKTSDRLTSMPDDQSLSEVRVRIIPAMECQNRYGSSYDPWSIICTSGKGRRGTCEGDSGGPLVVKRKGREILVGLTSFGDDSCESGEPSAFTRIASYLEFIHKHL